MWLVIQTSNINVKPHRHDSDICAGHFMLDWHKQDSRRLPIWAELFEGRLALNPGLILTRVSLSCVQKHFLG